MLSLRWVATVSLCFCLGCNSSQVGKKQTIKAEKIKEPLAVVDGNVALAFSPDGKWLAVGAELVDTSTWQTVAMLEPRVSDQNPNSKNHWGYASAAFSPDSKRLALGDQLGYLRFLDIPSMALSAEIHAHGARITGIGFASDNETVVTTSIDDTIRIWNSRTKEELFRDNAVDKDKTVAGFSGPIDVFAVSPDRELFAATDITKRLVIGTIRDGKILHDFKGPGSDTVELDSLAFSQDSSQLLVGVTPTIYVFNVKDASKAGEIQTKAESTLLVKTFANSDLVAMFYREAGFSSGTVELFDLAQQKSLGSFAANESRGAFWALSQDGQFMATTASAGPVHIWKVDDLMRELSSK